MSDKWYKKSYRRCLVDMHIPDWDERFLSEFDSDKYIEMMKLAGVDSAYIYANSNVGLCNYPTKVGTMHKGLKGRDIIKELTDGFNREGINPILYINIWSKVAFDEHPEWRTINPEGKISSEYMFRKVGRYGVLCPNSGYIEYVLGIVRELCSGYDFKALWIDMILWRNLCVCEHCKARFKKETGLDFPEKIDWDDPSWQLYMKKREEWMIDFSQKILDAVNEINPEISVIFNSAYFYTTYLGLSMPYFALGEFVSGDYALKRLEHSLNSKFADAVTREKPFEFLGSVMDTDLAEHSIIKTDEQLKSLMFSCIMSNGAYGFIDAIDPVGNLNERVYKRMKNILDAERPYEKYLDFDLDPVYDVGIYFNCASGMSPFENGEALHDFPAFYPFQRAFVNAGYKLIEGHVPFRIITEKNLDELDRCKLIILPDMYALSEKEINAFTEYVNGGGNIFASGHTALYDDNYKKIDGGGLKHLIGAEISGETGSSITYIHPTEYGEDILPDFTAAHPITCNSPQMIIKADDDTTILGKMSLPYTDPGDVTKFSSANSNPPGDPTDDPSVIMNKYGKGRVIYCAALPELYTKSEHHKFFVNMLKKAIGGEFSLITNAPKCVEISVSEQTAKNRYVVNMLNFQTDSPTVPVYNISVKLQLEKPVKRILAVPSETEIQFKQNGTEVEFTAEKLDIFEMFLLEY